MTDGIDMNEVAQALVTHGQPISMIVKATGTGDVTATVKLWGWGVGAGDYVPMGVHATAASKGLVNDANAMDETETDIVGHAEPVYQASDFPFIYPEITVIGADTTVTVWLQWRR
jgi:hypothetical protein